MDIRTSWIFGHHVGDWIIKYDLYLDIMDMLLEHKYPGKLDIQENDASEAFPMQRCNAKLYI